MSQNMHPPDHASLLPPLLACLPTGFASPRPPPALLPLLSPILRQRVQLLSATADSPTDSWLPLLCWKPGAAEKLASIVESDAFELHPVSGEIEYGEVGPILYRQLDEETLQAKIKIADLGLVVIYVWCSADSEGGGDGWRVSEVIPLELSASDSPDGWYSSVELAQHEVHHTTQQADRSVSIPVSNGGAQASINGTSELEEEDEDDYWAQYDKTPSRTPAANRSPMRGDTAATTGRARKTSEAEYFEQYSQVQPEMDNDDPSEDREAIGESSLTGNILASTTSRPPIEESLPNGFPPQTLSHDRISALQNSGLDQPRATSPTSFSETVSRLEGSATLQSNAESAIRQHVSTSIKSLFRLCRTAGIERLEFDEMVKTELETLTMLNEDD